jgi:GDP-mannose 6-dehydrogenase
MKISVFGLGYVGCVSLGCLAQNGHNIIGVDISKRKVDQINNGQATIIEKDIDIIVREQFELGKIEATLDSTYATINSDVCFITVGTPNSETGHLDLKYVYNVAKDIGIGLKGKNKFLTIVIRSTVFPGTGEQVEKIISETSGKIINKDFAVISNPEFLREGSAVYDYYHPAYTLIGGENKKALKIVGDLYKEVEGEVVFTKRNLAELMKYINNTFHALKVTFGNEIGNVCQSLGIDSHELMKIFIKDDKLNISPYYLMPGFSYGGSCLPKDLRGLQAIAHDNYLNLPIINNIDNSNNQQIIRAINIIEKLGFKKIGVLGISFKEGTDDFRNSPTISVIENLIGKGYEIKIFDKNINLTLLNGTNKDFIEKHIPHLNKYLNKKIENVIDASELILVAVNDKSFVEALKKSKEKSILDFVRIDEDLLKHEHYIGLNW